jgi:hypothetical protein
MRCKSEKYTKNGTTPGNAGTGNSRDVRKKKFGSGTELQFDQKHNMTYGFLKASPGTTTAPAKTTWVLLRHPFEPRKFAASESDSAQQQHHHQSASNFRRITDIKCLLNAQAT